MPHVEVYGAAHSPWVQAVLLGLHDAKIDYSLRTLPPLQTFLTSGIMMPAAKVDNQAWRLESADILRDLGFDAIPQEQKKLISRAWRGLGHRADSAALFWGNFSLAGDRHPSFVHRFANNFFRSFSVLTFFLLINFLLWSGRTRDPKNFGDQFVPFEEMLHASGAPYLSGEKPNTLDFLLFGMVQSHCSIFVPPVSALQSDPRLERLRDWICVMQERFAAYEYLYSGTYFRPFSKPPRRSAGADRLAFWLGAAVMVVAFPVTVPVIALLSIRNRMK